MNLSDDRVALIRLAGSKIRGDWSGEAFDGRDVQRWLTTALDGTDVQVIETLTALKTPVKGW